VTLRFLGPSKEPIVANGAVVPAGTYGYFVAWDDMPGMVVGVTGNRIRPVRVD
jgi:hypothetical protein